MSRLTKLTKQIALVTGAGTGIGAASAQMLAAKDAHIATAREERRM